MNSRSAVCLVAAVVVAVLPVRVANHGDAPVSQWSAPANLGPTVNSATGDFCPFVSRDGRSLYFSSLSCGTQEPPPPGSRPGFGGFDIYVARRDSGDAPWSPATNLGPAINTPAGETAPALSPDGHRPFFGSDRDGGFGGNDLYVSRRRDRRDDFGWLAPRNLGAAVNNTPDNEASPEMTFDEAGAFTVLYFDSNRPGGPGPFTDDVARNGSDIYASTLHDDGTFEAAVLVDALSSPSLDRQPTVRRDGLEVIFSSNRPGGVGGLDLWVSTRASTSEPWSVPIPVAGDVNGASDDAGPALSFDALTLYFQTARPGGVGAFDLHTTRRMKVRPRP